MTIRAYAGIDYSTRKVALALLESQMEPVVLSFEAPKRETGVDATKLVMKQFSDWCIQGLLVDTLAFIESPIMGRMLNAQTAVGMGIAAGALMQASIFYGAGIVEFVAPSFWKKRITGHGGMDKAGIGDWLAASQPELAAYCGNEDEKDAMCLALLAMQTHKLGMS